ncbi:GON-4-like protein isoform X2 [Pangasianodon hypophthalmus]|uniref:GON-4-like protein isoform X2 n=1 Tax=Pangasianodon hypophthalmus TaxID=310915 RepID=UPI0023079C0E|nr:GON-4-like protein isoform X2 [Pangasianodon hypophthalmus]
MKTGRKRKSSSPEPTHAKVAKREPRVYAESRLTFSPQKIFTPSKRKVPKTSSPRRHSSRFKCHGQETGNAESELDMVRSPSCLESSPLQSEVDTELGLVITLDEEGTGEPEQLRKKSGGKLMKELLTNDYIEMADNERDAKESNLDEDSEEEFRKLDRDLAIKSKQHNLTSVHVRSIIHEVITNEHVVAMMKAAIRETQDMPMFEPKMTRSKLREVVEKGVGIPSWNISPIKKSKEIKHPQFVDIPLEDEEDSSDEEYYPDEDEEDETAEETILESDLDSIASSPRISRRACSCTPVDLSECDEQRSNSPRMKPRHLRVEAVPMGPPAPPSQSGVPSRPSRVLDSFMEKLHAVDEELALNPLCMEPYQSLSNENAEESLVACRTRSKRPLRDVPLNQLEAELKAPDITPDMYDCVSALEDKEWSHWLQGLMTSHLDNEEEADDDDDPEYNFLDDLDEPDLEDYRNDRAVRITKKEVNELMEELFETFQDELGINEDEETHEEDEERGKVSSQSVAKFNVPQAIRFEEPLAQMLTVCRRTVREQLDALQQRREHQSRPQHSAPGPAMLLVPPPCTLMVTPNQKQQLQQQVQQHVQLLTQVNMLCSPVEALQSQATITKLFLTELQSFAERAEQMRTVVQPGFKSAFRVCNLQPSLELLEELEKTTSPPIPPPKSTQSPAVHRYPFLPAHLAWLFATRSVFLYPELLPHCSLDPALQPPRSKTIYTKGEDGLIVLGLKHFSETEFPYHLMSQYLIQPKRVEQLRARVKDMCSSRATDNIIKFYCQHHAVPPLPVACRPVVPGEERPPVEREKNIMPNWLWKSLPYIHKAVFERQSEETTSFDIRTTIASPPLPTFPEGTQYPLYLPKGLTLQLHPSAKRQSSVRPSKPRPLHGFARSASTPLAKAPLCPISTVNLLSPVPAPLPSQGVILLTQSPLIPVNEALPVTQVNTTPAHGTVPLNSVGPVNFQYVVPQQACVNPIEPPASLPPATVQIPSTLAVSCNRPLPSNGVGKCIKLLQKKAELPRKQIMPRKLLPIQPPLFNSMAPTVTSANFIENSSNPAPSVVIIQPSSLLDTPYVHPPVDSQGLVKSSTTPPHQDSFTQTVNGLPDPGTLSRPPLPSNSVRMSSPDTNKEPADSKFKRKNSPVFISNTPSPPLHTTESLKSSPSVQSVGNQEQSWPRVKGEFACDALVSNHQSNPLPDTVVNSTITTNLNCGSVAPRSRSIRVTPPNTNLSAHCDLPADNSQYILLQAASQVGIPQSFLMPKTSLIPNQPQLHSARGESKVPQQKTTVYSSETFCTPSMPNVREDHLSLLTVGLPLEGTISQAPDLPSKDIGDEELWKEDMEAGAKVGGEDLASTLFASPLLTLSESSCSPDSNLSSIGHMDCSTETLENIMEDSPNTGRQHSSHFSKESDGGSTHAPANSHRSEGQVSSTGEVPGLLTFTSGAESKEPLGGGRGLNKGDGGEEGEGHQNEERGGGEEKDANDKSEKRGDGDGGRESQGNGGRDRNDDEKDGDGEREEEEEDFDELTQDEDEEEVMSSASEESVLSVPELQETMEKLTWLASERRLCGEGDSEEDNSPNSPTSPTSPTSPISQNSQEENTEDEEDGALKGEELEPTEGEGGKLPEGDAPQEDDPPQNSVKGAGRGRGRGRPPPRSLRKSRRQERRSKDTSKLLLLYDDHILDNDPMRESKDIAYAQAYLNRVKEALQDTPGKLEEFLSLLYEFEQGSESRSAVELFCELKPLLKDWPELLRDFAAFLLPEQALECGLFEEQQAFERSRRFLRQLEISFGENPSHYQKIVKALQAASAPTPAGVEELKTQMATLLKGHTHLQGEFSVFFDELRPPPARPGQFEEAVWPEDGGNMTEGGDGVSLGSGGFEEVTLPDLEEEEETPKIPQITGKSRKRKELGAHRKYKACDWPEKHCPCHCHFSDHDAKHRRHKRKGCPRCHGIKGTDGSRSQKTGDNSFPTADPQPEKQEERDKSEKGVEEEKETETEVKDESGSWANSPHHEPEGQAWECIKANPLANPEEREDEEEQEEQEQEEEEEEEEWKEGERENCSSPSKSIREEEVPAAEDSDTLLLPQLGAREMAQQSRQSPSSETPVCAKNISLTPSGEKVVLWTREADRVILTACQQQGANQSTFQSVSAQLGNKTPSEVSKRFRDLMRLFHTSACQASSDEEATEQQSATDEEQD